jgi:UDP-N-acetylglucosamine pyrophosphorylase
MNNLEKATVALNYLRGMAQHIEDIYAQEAVSHLEHCITQTKQTEKELQKFKHIVDVIESGYKAIENGEAFEHGFRESRLIPSNWSEICLNQVLEDVVEKITPLIKEYLQDELTYQETINDRD